MGRGRRFASVGRFFERWHEVLPLLGFTPNQALQAPSPSVDVNHLYVRGEWTKTIPPRDFQPDPSKHIPDWGLSGEWHPMSKIQPFADSDVRIPCVWVLNCDGSYQPLSKGAAGYITDEDVAFSSEVVCAVKVHLAVTRPDSKTLVCEAASKRFYNVYPQLDPASIDAHAADSFAALSNEEARSWGIASWGRDGARDALVERDSGLTVHASFIGVGPWQGHACIVPLPLGADLSELFAHPDLVRSALRQVAAQA